MTDPKHWTDESSEFVLEQLVRAARSERPEPGALARVLSAAGVATAATTAASIAGAGASAGGAAAVKAGTLGAGTVLKWTLLSATLASGAGVATLAVREAEKPPAAVPGARAPSASVRPPVPPASSVRVLPPQPETRQETPAAAPKVQSQRTAAPGRGAQPDAAPTLNTDRLAEEVRAIDRARVSVSTGRSVEALGILDEYEKTFEAPGFAPEALYLRMEALSQLGRRAEAQSVAARLVQRYPNSPQAPRARQLLAEQKP